MKTLYIDIEGTVKVRCTIEMPKGVSDTIVKLEASRLTKELKEACRILLLNVIEDK